MTSRDPEAGTGVSYILERKIRLREGVHKVYFVLPEDDYIVAADITLRSGEDAVLEFKPLYWHKHIPYQSSLHLGFRVAGELFARPIELNDASVSVKENH